MKTLSQVRQERAEQAKEAEEAERAREARSREYLERDVLPRAIPLHASTTESSRQELRDRILGTTTERTVLFSGVASNLPRGTGVACDHCGTELFLPQPGIVTCAGSCLVQCPGCGWSGYM